VTIYSCRFVHSCSAISGLCLVAAWLRVNDPLKTFDKGGLVCYNTLGLTKEKKDGEDLGPLEDEVYSKQ